MNQSNPNSDGPNQFSAGLSNIHTIKPAQHVNRSSHGSTILRSCECSGDRICAFALSPSSPNWFIMWCLRTKPTIWLLLLSFTSFTEGRSRMSLFNPREGHRSVTPLDAARVSRTILHDHSAHWYHSTRKEGRARKEGRGYIKQANYMHGEQPAWRVGIIGSILRIVILLK